MALMILHYFGFHTFSTNFWFNASVSVAILGLFTIALALAFRWESPREYAASDAAFQRFEARVRGKIGRRIFRSARRAHSYFIPIMILSAAVVFLVAIWALIWPDSLPR